MPLEDIVAIARQHIGETYTLGAMVNYSDPTHTGPWDCAEFATWCTYQATGLLIGAEPDDPRSGDAYTGFWGDDAISSGLVVSIDEALRNAGYMLLRIPRRGRIGHIAISVGNGRDVVEAAGRNLGVVERSAEDRLWDYGVRIPSNDALPETIASAGQLYFRASRNPKYDLRVERIQIALRDAGLNPGPIDGKFGGSTETAVAQFQQAKGLVIDGVVGPETGRALNLPYWGGVVAGSDSDTVGPAGSATNDPNDTTRDYLTTPTPNFRALIANGSFSDNPHRGGGKRAHRTNNPGAINFDFRGGGAWQANIPGFVGRTFADNAGNMTAIYEAPEQGVAAWYHLFVARYNLSPDMPVSIRELSRRYAGVGSWTHAAARSYVAGWVRFSGGDLSEHSLITFSEDASVEAFALGCFGHELGEATALNAAQISHGIGLGRQL